MRCIPLTVTKNNYDDVACASEGEGEGEGEGEAEKSVINDVNG